MPDHRLIIARGFRIAGWVLGAPSLLAAIGLGWAAFNAGAGGAHTPHPLDVTTYGLVGLLANAADGLAGILALLNGLAAWVFGLLAALALAAALFAALLHRIGRGLDASAAWARLLGATILALLALNTLLALTILRDAARLADAAAFCALTYGLWVLGWRFRPRPG